MRRIITPTAWVIYLAIVFEFLFMITPFALYFYSAYRPALGLLNSTPWTAWLTGFFLPHFSQTQCPLINALGAAGWYLAYFGLGLFLLSAVQLYGAKLFRRKAVTGWLYRYIRHPQYLALAVLGLGMTLIWPRFIVLVTYVTMLALYGLLARYEEHDCVRKYGDSYVEYQKKTGMFLPGWVERGFAAAFRLHKFRSTGARWVMFLVLMTAALGAGFALREHTLSSITAVYLEGTAVLSPAILDDDELLQAYRLAGDEQSAGDLLAQKDDRAPLLVYVVPRDWYMPDLPIDPPEVVRGRGGHGARADFDRRYYRVLVARARTHAENVLGRNILRRAHALEPLLLVDVDLERNVVTSVSRPPSHVVWGDIASPLY